MARRSAAEALTSIFMVSALERELTEGGLANLFDEVEMPLLPVLARMELAGIRIDLDALEAMREEFAATLAGLESRIYELVGHEFNIGSPRQLETVLFDELELPSTKRTRTSCSRTHRSSRSCAAAPGDRPDPRAPPGGQAEVDLRRRAADAGGPATAGCTPPTTRRSPRPAGCRAPIRTCRTSRSAPRSAADPPRLRRARLEAAARRRLLPAGAAHPRPRLRRRGAEGGLRGPRTSTSRPPRALAVGRQVDRGAERGEDDQLRDRLRAARLRPRDRLRIRARRRAVHRDYYPPTRASAATRRDKILARDQGFVKTLLGRRRYRRSWPPATDPSGRPPSAWPSTCQSRALPPTSSSSPWPGSPPRCPSAASGPA